MNDKNPANFRPHTFASLRKKPIHFLAFGLGSGLIHPAPGTWGTLAATLLYWPLSCLLINPAITAIFLLAVFALGCWVCDKTARDLGVHDFGEIVWDEFLGVWLVLASRLLSGRVGERFYATSPPSFFSASLTSQNRRPSGKSTATPPADLASCLMTSSPQGTRSQPCGLQPPCYNPPPTNQGKPMKISKNSVVEVTYELYDDQGNAIVHDGEPLTYLHGGYGGTFPKVEAALDGKDVGDQVELTLTPNDHFGEIQDEYIRQEPREILPPEIEVGMVLEGEDTNGNIQLFHISDIGDTHVTLNGNHPLAGLTLRFKAKVQSVREATAEEIAHGHVHGPHGHHHHH